jgi:hypothetical protein
MIRSIICTHPQGIKSICACGTNRICPICGYGQGVMPCDCDRKRADDNKVKDAFGKYKRMFSEAWRELA